MASTIFALSSGPGPSGVAVVRVSGPLTRALVKKVTKQDLPEPRRAVLREFIDPATQGLIDKGLLLFFPAPHSFTGEDVAEFHLHGSLASIRAISATLMKEEGVTAAEAGAFTQRAFLNGKLDLIEVEALGDLLAAETLEQARLAQLAQQVLRRAADGWREDVLSLLALTEAGIDFSDEDDVVRSIDSSAEQIFDRLGNSLKAAIESYPYGERIRRGFRVALCGPPNAGKSSLLNALAQRDVAIVSPIAGTTRDIIEVHLDLGGYPVILCDTAGIRLSHDPIEQEGIKRARTVADQSDLTIWLSPMDHPVPCPLEGAVILTSKADLEAVDSHPKHNRKQSISVTTGVGMDELISYLGAMARMGCGQSDGLVVLRERQVVELQRANLALMRGQSEREFPELRAEEIREALRHLDRLTGRIDHEEVLGAIFSRFCIGK
jgi:tRNA modification GTPase